MPVCSIKGCNEVAYDFGFKLLLCSRHLVEAEKVLTNIRRLRRPAPQPAKAAKPAPAKPAAKPPTKKVLIEDAELETMIMRRLEKKGLVSVSSILKNYRVGKGDHPSATARLVEIMKSLADRDPRLLVEKTANDTILRRMQEAPQQPQQQQ